MYQFAFKDLSDEIKHFKLQYNLIQTQPKQTKRGCWFIMNQLQHNDTYAIVSKKYPLGKCHILAAVVPDIGMDDVEHGAIMLEDDNVKLLETRKLPHLFNSVSLCPWCKQTFTQAILEQYFYKPGWIFRWYKTTYP